MQPDFGSESRRTLDPLAELSKPMVKKYDTYMTSVYEPNMIQRNEEYADHYGNMGIHLGDWLEDTMGAQQLPRAEQMNFAFVGLLDGEQELGRSVQRKLTRMRSILLIDFSSQVLRRAAVSLMKFGVSGHKIHYMQYDITDGLSEVVDEWMTAKMITCGEDEDAFHLFFEALEKQMADGTIMIELNERLEERKAVLMNQTVTVGADLLHGGVNKERKLCLNIRGEDYPIDAASYQMVNAAAFVPTKDHVLEHLVEAAERSSRSDEQIQTVRRRTLERVYAFFALLNTQITLKNVTRIIDDNQGKTRALLLTDKSTRWVRPLWGEMPQLNIDGGLGLKDAFHRTGKEMNERSQVWYWKDLYEEYGFDTIKKPLLDFAEHEHTVQAIEVYQNGKTENPS